MKINRADLNLCKYGPLYRGATRATLLAALASKNRPPGRICFMRVQRHFTLHGGTEFLPLTADSLKALGFLIKNKRKARYMSQRSFSLRNVEM